MTYLLHGFRGMGWVDKVPRAGNLYIGGLYALYQTDLIKQAGITHVLSVIDYEPGLDNKEQFRHLKHLHIRADDEPNQDLLQHFPQTCRFIDEALERDDGRGAVFVHCAMGKSRSAAAVVAFLMWKHGGGPAAALAQVCEGRPVCGPNVGFMEQLGVWEEMVRAERDGKGVEAREEIYQRWLTHRFKGEWWEWDAREGKDVKVGSRL